jgi:hypothetical protein
VERENVGRAEQVVERDPVAAPVVRDAHPERVGAPGDLGADPPHPHQPERRAGEVAAEQLGSRPAALPAPFAHEAVRLDEVAAAGEDQREGQVGHRRVEDARRVRDGDPALAAGGYVHGVVADAVVRHEPQVGEEVELGVADPDDDRHERLDAREWLPRRPGLEELDLRELIPRRSGEPLRRGDPHRGSIPAVRRFATCPRF